MHKAVMPANERDLRSKLTKAVTFNEFVRGTVDVRAKKCMINGKRMENFDSWDTFNGKVMVVRTVE